MRSLSRCLSLCLCSVTLLVAGCQGNTLYSDFRHLPEEAWKADSLAIFRVDIADTTQLYDVSVELRNDNNYGFANLWLFVDVVSPEGTIRRDTVECLLANPDGSWKGAGWGSLYSLRCPYLPAVRFARTGTYTFRFQQGMRDEQLEGIRDIGLLVEKACQ